MSRLFCNPTNEILVLASVHQLWENAPFIYNELKAVREPLIANLWAAVGVRPPPPETMQAMLSLLHAMMYAAEADAKQAEELTDYILSVISRKLHKKEEGLITTHTSLHSDYSSFFIQSVEQSSRVSDVCAKLMRWIAQL